jgi:predicted ABC-type ATPase
MQDPTKLSISRKRFRIFAGPNGSGKSTLYNQLINSTIHTKLYVAADKIEAEMRDQEFFDFTEYNFITTEEEFKMHAKRQELLDIHGSKQELLDSLRVRENRLTVNNRQFIDSYLASSVASYLTQKLFETNQSFCFETVMSHHSKIELLQQARKLGYKTYLYFVFTENPDLNVLRIAERVKKGGHNVSEEKVKSRFDRSIGYLPEAAAIADNTYIIENSTAFDPIIYLEDGRKTIINEGYPFKEKLPGFFEKFKIIMNR